MDSTNRLSGKKRLVAEYLDDEQTYDDLCEKFGFSQSTARDYISDIRRAGIPIGDRREDGKKVFYRRDLNGEHPTNVNKNQRSSGFKKATKTKRANNELNAINARLTKLLNNSEPAIADGGHPQSEEREDVAIHVTDDHHGDLVSDEFGEETFNTDVSIYRAEQRIDNVMKLVTRQEAAGYEFDTANYIMGGDIVTGAGIYEGQAHEVERNLNEQIDEASRVHLEQIRRLSKRFPTVKVVCQTGNHGEIRVSGSAKEANADDILYRMLDLAVRESDMENVTLIRNDHTRFTNFEMRGHRAHLRHGDDSLEHIGTSAAKRRWRGWKLDHDFDIAYRGHYHQPSKDYVREAPVIMSGSIKPPSDFEESIAEWSMPSATIHGVSDTRPITWCFDVDFD